MFMGLAVRATDTEASRSDRTVDLTTTANYDAENRLGSVRVQKRKWLRGTGSNCSFLAWRGVAWTTTMK